MCTKSINFVGRDNLASADTPYLSIVVWYDKPNSFKITQAIPFITCSYKNRNLLSNFGYFEFVCIYERILYRIRNIRFSPIILLCTQVGRSFIYTSRTETELIQFLEEHLKARGLHDFMLSTTTYWVLLFRKAWSHVNIGLQIP